MRSSHDWTVWASRMALRAQAKFLTLLFLLLLAGCGGNEGMDVGSLDLASLDVEPEPVAATTAPEASAPTTTVATSPKRRLALEKDALRLGIIKLTDCAPIVIAKEKGFFDAEGLQVEVIAQPNWKTLLDNVIRGELDGAHMLSGQPIAATIGIGTSAHVITTYTMDLNGNAITVSNAVWEQMKQHNPELAQPTPKHPITADNLRPIVSQKIAAGERMQLAMTFPVSTHNYELRYWLAAGGIHPGFYSPTDVGGRTDAEVELSVTPPPMMPATLEAGNIQGYCVGEPWNQQAVAKGIGVPVTTTFDVRKNKPEKVFGVTAEWATKHPQTHLALLKGLIRAGQWLDATDADGKYLNRDEACRILARPDYVGADYEVLKNSMTGYFYFQRTDKREMPDFNVFFKYYCTYPWYSDGIWFLTQMRRWGQIPESKPAEWYHETAAKVYRPDIYKEAAAMLVEEGLLSRDDVPWDSDGYRPASSEFIDGIPFDGRDPIGYLNAHTIGLKDQ